jgi:hypothetical protein
LVNQKLEEAKKARLKIVKAEADIKALQAKFPSAPEMLLSPDELHDAQIGWAKAQAESFAKWLATKGETSRRVGDGIWPVFRNDEDVTIVNVVH